MKRIAYIFILLLSSILIFSSCHKDLDNPYQRTDEEVVINPKIDIVIGFYFTWDEWGRKKYNCHGAGLCRFRLEAIVVSIGKSTPVNINAKGELFVEVPVDDDLIFEDTEKNFYIDEDLFAPAPDSKIYMIPKGVYKFNSSLGEKGGILLPLKTID